jgi:hypothetical protein
MEHQGQWCVAFEWILHATAAPFHRDLQPQRYTRLQKSIKKAVVTMQPATAIAIRLPAGDRTGPSVDLDDVAHQLQSAPFIQTQ